MPTAIRYLLGKYKVHFWSNELEEPVHVHVTRTVPSSTDTKFWLYADGVVRHEPASGIKTVESRDLREIEKELTEVHFQTLYEQFVKTHPDAELKQK